MHLNFFIYFFKIIVIVQYNVGTFRYNANIIIIYGKKIQLVEMKRKLIDPI